MKTKICNKCGKEIQYENDIELSEYFYKKQKWYLNSCIECEHKRHRENYKKGKYKYYKRKDHDEVMSYKLGNNNSIELEDNYGDYYKYNITKEDYK